MGTETNSNTISRREILKRGAFVGGAVLWVAPAVQVVGMGRAFAKDVSPNCSRYCIKWDFDTNAPPPDVTQPLTCTKGGTISAYPIWGNTWTAIGNAADVAKALTCTDGTDTDTSAMAITNRSGNEFVVYGTQLAGFWVAFPPDTKLAYLADVGLESVGAKCGTATATFTPTVEDDPCYTDPNGVPFKRIHVTGCNNGSDISHIEMIVDWCPNSAPS